MIDAVVILFSVGMCMFVAYRAFRLDSVLPWFGPEAGTKTATTNEPAAALTGWRARARAGRGR